MRIPLASLIALALLPAAFALPAEPEVWDCAYSNSFFPGQYFDLGDAGGIDVRLRLDVPLPPMWGGSAGPLGWIVTGDENSLYVNQERHLSVAWVDGPEGRLYETARAQGVPTPGVHAGDVDVRAPGIWCGGGDTGLPNVPPGEYRVVLFAASDMGSSMGLSIATEATILSATPLQVAALFDDDLPCDSSFHLATGVGEHVLGDVRSYEGCRASFRAEDGFCAVGRVGEEHSEENDAHWTGPAGEVIPLTPDAALTCAGPGEWRFEVPRYGSGAPGGASWGITALAANVLSR